MPVSYSGLQKCDPSTLVEMDHTYLERIRHRRQLLAMHPNETHAANPVSITAVNELYQFFMSYYLPTRFPNMLRLQEDNLLCTVTNETFPTSTSSPKGMDLDVAVDALRVLSGLIDLDVLVLLPLAPDLDGSIRHTLEAYTVCFPNGFNTAKKMGLRLADIHAPVPGYAQKLGKSMDRYFERLTAGNWVQRANWTITTHSKLYTPGDDGEENHLKSGQEIPTTNKGFRIEDCRVRVESQKLFRMPGTGAIVFAFKTYLTPLRDVKESEGRDAALALAEAIEGMRKGSAPDVCHYTNVGLSGQRKS